MPTSAATSIPAPALLLGAGGLLPFAGGAAAQILTHDPRWLPLLASYGAVILSFVGALHWGYAVRDVPTGASAWLRYGWSVVPALAGWICLMLPATIAVMALAGALVACLVMDEFFSRGIAMPAWLLPLRRALTAGGAGCLLIAGLA